MGLLNLLNVCHPMWTQWYCPYWRVVSSTTQTRDPTFNLFSRKWGSQTKNEPFLPLECTLFFLFSDTNKKEFCHLVWSFPVICCEGIRFGQWRTNLFKHSTTDFHLIIHLSTSDQIERDTTSSSSKNGLCNFEISNKSSVRIDAIHTKFDCHCCMVPSIYAVGLTCRNSWILLVCQYLFGLLPAQQEENAEKDNNQNHSNKDTNDNPCNSTTAKSTLGRLLLGSWSGGGTDSRDDLAAASWEGCRENTAHIEGIVSLHLCEEMWGDGRRVSTHRCSERDQEAVGCLLDRNDDNITGRDAQQCGQLVDEVGLIKTGQRYVQKQLNSDNFCKELESEKVTAQQIFGTCFLLRRKGFLWGASGWRNRSQRKGKGACGCGDRTGSSGWWSLISCCCNRRFFGMSCNHEPYSVENNDGHIFPFDCRWYFWRYVWITYTPFDQ